MLVDMWFFFFLVHKFISWKKETIVDEAFVMGDPLIIEIYQSLYLLLLYCK